MNCDPLWAKILKTVQLITRCSSLSINSCKAAHGAVCGAPDSHSHVQVKICLNFITSQLLSAFAKTQIKLRFTLQVTEWHSGQLILTGGTAVCAPGGFMPTGPEPSPGLDPGNWPGGRYWFCNWLALGWPILGAPIPIWKWDNKGCVKSKIWSKWLSFNLWQWSSQWCQPGSSEHLEEEATSDPSTASPSDQTGSFLEVKGDGQRVKKRGREDTNNPGFSLFIHKSNNG